MNALAALVTLQLCFRSLRRQWRKASLKKHERLERLGHLAGGLQEPWPPAAWCKAGLKKNERLERLGCLGHLAHSAGSDFDGAGKHQSLLRWRTTTTAASEVSAINRSRVCARANGSVFGDQRGAAYHHQGLASLVTVRDADGRISGQIAQAEFT
jgi:hypothetical protein